MYLPTVSFRVLLSYVLWAYFIIREEKPSPLPVGCLTHRLQQLTCQNCVMVALGYRFILLLPATGGSALPGAPFRLSTPHQARVETPLPEVHPPGDSGTDLLCPADAQHLCKNNVGKDEESLGVPTPTEYPLPLLCQDGREAVPNCS